MLIPNAQEYRAALVGQLYELGNAHYWEDDGAGTPEIVSQVWRESIAASLTFGDVGECGDNTSCHTFSPGASFVQWFPNDPYRTPTLVPDGYNLPPWYLSDTVAEATYGTESGDVLTSLDRFPPGSLPTIIPSSGLPRFRVNLYGEGVVTLHLVNIIAGSLLQVTIDDEIGTLRFIEVDRDLISLPTENNWQLDIDIEITGAGNHHIDCIVVSWINESIPFLHHGASLRSVDLCGFTEMAPIPPTMIRTTACGDMEQSPDSGENWYPIADSNFLRSNGDCPMVGGLRILPITTEVGLEIRHAGNWQTGDTTDIIQVKRPDGQVMTKIDSAGNLRLDTSNGGGDILKMYRFDYSELIANIGRGTVIRPTGNLACLALKPQASLRPIVVWPSDVNSVPFFVQGRSGQVANLQEWASNWNIAYVESFIRANGTAQFGALDDSATSVLDALTLNHDSTSATESGFGTSIALQGKSSISSNRDMVRLAAQWSVATDSVRQSTLLALLYGYSTPRQAFAADYGVDEPEIAFLGQTPSPRLAISGDAAGNQVLKDVVAALAAFGLVTDDVTLGSASDVCDWRCRLALGGMTALFDRITNLMLYVLNRKASGHTLTAVQADTDTREIWGYTVSSPSSFDALIALIWNYSGDMYADMVSIAEELIIRIYCELDDCGQVNALWQENIYLDLLDWDTTDIHYFAGSAIQQIPSLQAEATLSSGLMMYPLGALDCDTFDCEALPVPGDPDPEFDWCILYDFTIQEQWRLDTSYAGSGIGEWALGYGWKSEEGELTPETVVIRKDDWSSAVTVNRITVVAEFAVTDFDDEEEHLLELRYGVTNVLLSGGTYGTPGIKVLTWTSGGTSIGEMRVYCSSSLNDTNNVRIISAKIEGSGTPPDETEGIDCYA
jgi:hypothetical protein